MKVTIMQPAYLPWLGFFHRITLSDLFIVLDHVEIDRNSKTGFAHRNRVRTRQGETWLTVPLKTKGRRGELQLNQIEIANDGRWATRHWRTLQHAYSNTPCFHEYSSALGELYSRTWRKLIDLQRATLQWHLAALGIETQVLFSSEMQVAGTKDQLILNLCRTAGASTYISGPFGREYLNEECFRDGGIEILFHDYQHPQYTQAHSDFLPYMATVDLLFNHGDASRGILDNSEEVMAA